MTISERISRKMSIWTAATVSAVAAKQSRRQQRIFLLEYPIVHVEIDGPDGEADVDERPPLVLRLQPRVLLLVLQLAL